MPLEGEGLEEFYYGHGGHFRICLRYDGRKNR